MADIGINFRATSTFVTDGTNETYCLATDTYPTTRGGFTFGWETIVSGTADSRDRDSGVDRRLAGLHVFQVDGEAEFRIDLPSTGTYDVRAAFGDALAAETPSFIFKDGTTAFKTQAETAVSTAEYLDATGTTYSAANWPSSNTAVSRTFTTTIFRCRIGPGSAASGQPVISHLSVTLTAASSDAITATDLDNGRIFQRDAGETTKTITFSGTYTNTTPTTVEVKIVDASDSSLIQDWTELSSASISGGDWSGDLSVPQGGMYHFLARGIDSDGTTVLATTSESTHDWGVGVLVAMIGQSNMRNMWSVISTPPASDSLTRRHSGSGWFAVDNDGTNFGGNGSVVLANLLRSGIGVPIGLLEFAIGSTEVATWESGGTSFTAFSSNSSGVARSDVGSDFEYVLWHQGERDAQLGTTKADYKTGLDGVYSACRTLTGRTTSTLKFGCALVGNIDDPTATDASMDAIRQGQLEWIRDTTGVFFAGSSVDMVRDIGDSWHWTAPYYERMAHRYAQAILHDLGLETNGAEGPKLASASRDSGSADITLTITQNGGTALKEADGTTDGGSLTGLEVSDDDFSTTLTISSTAISSGNVVLTLSAAPADSDTIKVRYQYGENPSITNVLYDDQTPQSDTLGFPLQPTIGSVTASLTSTATGYANLLLMGVG